MIAARNIMMQPIFVFCPCITMNLPSGYLDPQARRLEAFVDQPPFHLTLECFRRLSS
jgi:hypothetical protein